MAVPDPWRDNARMAGPNSRPDDGPCNALALSGRASMPHRRALVLLLMAGVGGLRGVGARAGEPPAYEVYAVRYARMPGFPVVALVDGAEPGRELGRAWTC